MTKNKRSGNQKSARKPGRPKGSKNVFRRDARRTMEDVIVGLEQLEIGRTRLRQASAALSAPKTILALAAIRVQALRVVRVLDPLFG